MLSVRPRAGFDKKNLEWLEKIFKQTVGNEREIRREEFNTIVTSKNVGRKHKYSLSQTRRDYIFIIARDFDFLKYSLIAFYLF